MKGRVHTHIGTWNHLRNMHRLQHILFKKKGMNIEMIVSGKGQNRIISILKKKDMRINVCMYDCME